ncbi:MAG: hypothetical protein KGL18_20200 [Burkholderiales bacterium]|nr:hypothetical protein [Burkholderiales bacterium]MDE1927134.1 hypothetical protein [Burkholderiales bacterium]MDE2158341.1 hypothetical protein [Burkholderiales bacterium]MDE2505290.1 hypothetical protein [Burkholderiales bacterium]
MFVKFLPQSSTNRRVRQRGQVGLGSYGFGLAVGRGGELFTSGHAVATDAVMVRRSELLDMGCPDDFRILATIVDGPVLAGLWQDLLGRGRTAPATRPAIRPDIRSEIERIDRPMRCVGRPAFSRSPSIKSRTWRHRQGLAQTLQ